jgi:hypothetical protein
MGSLHFHLYIWLCGKKEAIYNVETKTSIYLHKRNTLNSKTAKEDWNNINNIENKIP